MDVDPSGHRRADIFDRRRVPDPRGMVVDQVALKQLDLLVVQHDLGELSDARVGPVHDLMRLELLFQHRPAYLNPLERRGREFYLLAEAGDTDQLLYRE